MLESNLGLVSLGVGGWRKKRKEKKKVLGSVSLDIGSWKKKIIIINNKVKAALTQSMGPTKSKFFWVVKIENIKHATLKSSKQPLNFCNDK